MRLGNKPLVDFVGVGAEKAGSTWLADMLRQHPEVFVPEKKEIYFFNEFDPHFLKVRNPKYEWGIDWYLDHFRKVSREKIKGEFSPTYLYSEKTAKRIFKYFPNVKIFIVLRNPVERAFSQYIQDKRFGLLDGLSFMGAIEKYDMYIKKSLYSEHVNYYLEIFEKPNVKIFLLADIKKEPKKILGEAFSFLELQNISFQPKTCHRKSNAAKKARLVGLNKFMISKEYALRNSRLVWLLKYLETSGLRELAIKIRELNSISYETPPRLDNGNKRKLFKYFEKDIKSLEKLIKRDLSRWQ